MADDDKVPRERLNVFLATDWIKKLHKISKRDDKSLNELIREAVRDYLRKDMRSKVTGPIAEYIGPKPDDDPVTEAANEIATESEVGP